jgi:sec-independent protein translocase protein TatA
MGALSPAHWLVVIGVVVLLFGANRLPDAARSVGQSLRILKAETSGLGQPDDDAASGPARPDD